MAEVSCREAVKSHLGRGDQIFCGIIQLVRILQTKQPIQRSGEIGTARCLEENKWSRWAG